MSIKRSNLQNFRIVLFTSLFWVVFDAFLFIYLVDINSTSRLIQSCEENIKELKSRLSDKQHEFNNLKLDSLKVGNDQLLTDRFHKIGDIKKQLAGKDRDDKNNYEQTKKSFENTENNFIEKIKQWFVEGNEQSNPSDWPGENGRAVVVPGNLKDQAKKRFKENQFNIIASDLVALNRSLPDQRSDKCKKLSYPEELPTTSIIIVYHNEGNSTLLRGLTSIVRRSPPKYLKEIILVDDASEGRDYLHGSLDQFIKTLPVSIQIFRNEERMGLMRSRMRGANAATGDTMTFLDAHIEVTTGWLPPLLAEIKKNNKAVVCPVIDVISDDTFEYLTGSEMTYGGFDSHFVFDWIPVPERENSRRNNDFSLALRSPTMAGGLFTIDRTYFYELGAYDEGMDVWGAENIEMSLRIWMCGGTLLILPCSHVGHVFRKQTPYSFPGGTNKVIFKNNRRLVDVWSDEYKTYFHKVIPDLNNVDAGDISDRLELRKKLQCKSFKWYLENIYPEAPLPKDFYHVGAIQNSGQNICLDLMNRKAGEDAGASFCHHQGGNQIFEYSKSHQLANGNLCLDTNGIQGTVKLNNCNKKLRSQQWDYDNFNEYFRNRQTSSCLTLSENNMNQVTTTNCDSNSKNQKWTFSDSIFESTA